MSLFPLIFRRFALLALAGLFFYLIPPLSAAETTPEHPNVLLIVADDLGYGDLGCYGQNMVKTPNLDQLASKGMRFTQFYAGSAIDNASRATLLTGKHTGHSSIRGVSMFSATLASSEVTLGEMFQRADYRTGAIGIWDLGDSGTSSIPNKHGFKDWVGFLTRQHAQLYYPPFLYRNESLLLIDQNKDNAKGIYAPDLLLKSADSYIRINSPAPYAKDRRFFLYFASQLPHANIDLGRATGNGMEIPSDAAYKDQAWTPANRNRAAMVTRLDHDIGQLMDRLEKSKVDTNTVVIFTSSNGPYAAGGADPRFFNATDGLRGQRGELYEGGLRVPLIVWWPGHVAEGKVNDTPCAMWDILPTLAELTGTKAPANIDGHSLVPALKGKAQKPADYLYWELYYQGFHQALRLGDWKAVHTHGKPFELYNLKNDPREKKNLAADFPDEVKRLGNLMQSARTDSEQWPLPEVADKP